ncbi:MAG: hypothetical protein NUK65_02935 [Firmicutes bacterium]|nr:hypothetical protein [Bacillota bacterium]
MSENNYTTAELFAELKNDDSWENDPEVREKIAAALYASLLRAV